jgi:hypothetical protein
MDSFASPPSLLWVVHARFQPMFLFSMYVTRPSSCSPRSLLADQPELRPGIHQVYKEPTPDESATSPPVLLPNQSIGPRKSLARRTQGTARIGEALQPKAQSYSSRRMFQRSEQTAVCGESLKSSSSRNTLWTDFICCSLTFHTAFFKSQIARLKVSPERNRTQWNMTDRWS